MWYAFVIGEKRYFNCLYVVKKIKCLCRQETEENKLWYISTPSTSHLKYHTYSKNRMYMWQISQCLHLCNIIRGSR